MKVTVDWIKEYCPVTLGIDELCERLTMGVAPLESSSVLPDGDRVLELEITSNRGDLMGVLGVAREVHAITGTPLRLPDISYSTVSKKVGKVARVTVEDPELCPRYIARVVEGIKVGPSPAWLTRRLESVGLRSVNNVVDVTNFVCLEYGQPLHAFDLDRLAGSHIIVRRAREGEAMSTLDGKKQALSPERLVIADEKDAVAIAGVMGGQDSEVTTDTTRILLESASFDAASIRRTARSLAMSTESSNRFGRGVAWEGVDQASRRAIALILQVAGGEALQGEIDISAPGAGDSREIALRFEQISRLTGVSIPPDRAVSILESLGCAVVARREDSVTVSAPGHRRDLGREADLIEEVLRIFGYVNVSENPKLAFFPVEPNLLESYRSEVQDLMRGFGYREVLTLSFGAPEADLNPSPWTDAEPLRCLDPVRPELAGLRRGLLSGLIGVKKLNLDHGNEGIRIFEVGRAFLPGKDLPTEKEVLGVLVDEDPLALKGLIESLLTALGSDTPLRWKARPFLLFRPDASWECHVGEKRLGVLGILTPGALGREGGDVSAAELDVEVLASLMTTEREFRALPRYPGARRDISLILDESVTWGQVEEVLRNLGEPTLQDVALFDLYRGKQIPVGKKNFAFSLTFRSKERTLSGEEVETFRHEAIEALQRELGGKIRT